MTKINCENIELILKNISEKKLRKTASGSTQLLPFSF